MLKKPQSKLTLALGTQSAQKIGYLKEILAELGLEAELISCAVQSGVSDQPLTSKDTLTGATNRAKAALAELSQADYAIGIEVGYEKVKNKGYEIFCWSVVRDQDGNQFQAKSHSLLLPGFYQAVLKEGRYLGDHVREYFAVSPDPVTQYLAEAVRGRRLFICESLRFALIYALHKEYYCLTK